MREHKGWGLVPRSIHYFFDLVRDREAQLWKGVDSIYEIKVECYMVELYKNFLYDLLLPVTYSKRKQKLDIIEDVSGCTYINGATVSLILTRSRFMRSMMQTLPLNCTSEASALVRRALMT